MRVMTIVGTRPEIIRLSRVLAKLEEHTDHTFVHTGQNYDYELTDVFFDELGIKHPDIRLSAAGATASETIGKVIIECGKVLEAKRPEALLILGDTNSALAAIAAKRLKIPIFHMEAGNRCFDARVPEETNRRIVDVIADVNMPYSSLAREYLIQEGAPADRIIKTGSPMFEVLDYYRPRIETSDVLARLGLEEGRYFVVSCHREENVDDPSRAKALAQVLNRLAQDFAQPVIVSTHPRTRKRIEEFGIEFSALVQMHKPFGFFDYLALQKRARAVLSDSGTITEESSILNFPALNIREAHERPEGFEEAAVMLTGFNYARIAEGLAILDHQPRGEERLLLPVADYMRPNVSDKVLRIIISYTDYIRRTVWGET